MNGPTFLPNPVRPTQAAEGLPRRAFSVADLERMVEFGILAEHDRLELVGGELVVMPAKGLRHEALRAALNSFWIRRAPPDLSIVPVTTLRLSADTFLEPDFLLYRAPVTLRTVRGPSALLVVEVAEASLSYDLHRKPSIYSQFGVPEVWVIDAVRRETHVCRGPGEGRYAQVSVHPGSEQLFPLLAGDLPLRLDDLEMNWNSGDPV